LEKIIIKTERNRNETKTKKGWESVSYEEKKIKFKFARGWVTERAR
jgi:hypothetical protein